MSELSSRLAEADLAYFAKGSRDNSKYWSRLGGKPDFTDKVVLDIGCGWGALCVDIASSGAKRVIGIDLVPSRIQFCQSNVSANFPALQDRMEFHCCELSELKLTDKVDVIVSKDTFEHVLDLPQLLDDAYACLKPGGRLMAGFGPLYHSYFGDHKATDAKFPWFHLIIPEKILLLRLNRKRGLNLKSIKDLGLNMMRFCEYQRCFADSKFEVIYLKVNGSTHPVSRLFNVIRKLPYMKDYFTQSIYAIFKK